MQRRPLHERALACQDDKGFGIKAEDNFSCIAVRRRSQSQPSIGASNNQQPKPMLRQGQGNEADVRRSTTRSEQHRSFRLSTLRDCPAYVLRRAAQPEWHLLWSPRWPPDGGENGMAHRPPCQCGWARVGRRRTGTPTWRRKRPTPARDARLTAASPPSPQPGPGPRRCA